MKSSHNFDNRQLSYYDFATGSERTLLDSVGPMIYPGLSASPAGDSLLMARQDSFSSDIMLAENFD